MTVSKIESLKPPPDTRKYDSWGYNSLIAIIDQIITLIKDNYL